MYSLANYLIFLVTLVIVSLFELHNPILVNGRKLTINSNACFSIDLIPRNSSKTILGSVSHHHHIRLSSKFYDTNNIQTDVISDGGDYAMKISVGTPPVEFTAISDTGSDLMWVQCSPCQQCLAQQSPLFDPTKSSTNIKIACTSQVCDSDQLGLVDTSCTKNDGSCAYLAGYGDGTQTVGVLSTETITFPSPATSYPSLLFGCGYYQEGSVGPQGDGIIGLGGGPLSLVTHLGPNINYKFSYCLTSLSSGLNSKLNFGLDVSGLGVVSTPFSDQDTPPTFYYLTLNSISIGATSVPVANNIIIDSGSTLTYLPSDVYEGVRTAMKSAVGLNPVADPYGMFDPCYESGSDEFNPPDVVFHFSGADVVLKAKNSFWMANGLTCLAMVPSDNTFIFGNVAQVNFHVGYDLQAKQVSFAPTDCSQFD